MHPYIPNVRVMFMLEEFDDQSLSLTVNVFNRELLVSARANVHILYDKDEQKYGIPVFLELDFYETDFRKQAKLHDALMSSLVLFLRGYGYEEEITVLIQVTGGKRLTAITA